MIDLEHERRLYFHLSTSRAIQLQKGAQINHTIGNTTAMMMISGIYIAPGTEANPSGKLQSKGQRPCHPSPQKPTQLHRLAGKSLRSCH